MSSPPGCRRSRWAIRCGWCTTPWPGCRRPPAERNARLPTQLSRIVMRLLEKDPDRRYQSADGLALDLARLREDVRLGRDEPIRVGRAGLPAAAVARRPGWSAGPPKRPRCERRSTRRWPAAAGGCWSSGASGVGKTALVNELRSVVTGRDGWFVTGKYDQYRHDADDRRRHRRRWRRSAGCCWPRARPRSPGYGPGSSAHWAPTSALAASVPDLAALLDLPSARPETAAGAGCEHRRHPPGTGHDRPAQCGRLRRATGGDGPR